jgi:hypothetical protein
MEVEVVFLKVRRIERTAAEVVVVEVFLKVRRIERLGEMGLLQ